MMKKWKLVSHFNDVMLLRSSDLLPLFFIREDYNVKK